MTRIRSLQQSQSGVARSPMREIALEEHQKHEGQIVDVLVEGTSRHDEGVICGRTGTFKTVNFPGSADLVGQTIPVRLTRAFTNSFRGERHG